MPQFQNADGISVVSQTQTGREIDLTVNTTDVQGQHKIIVLLPEGYAAHPSTRYPVLYLLNGALADPTQWVSSGGAAAQITDPYPAIIVMEDGGVKGWYYNWKSCASICPENWESFHNLQVVPWIDSNLRTIANRSGRGIGGLSMGGWGAIHYAEDYSQLYSYAASFSGARRHGQLHHGRGDRRGGGRGRSGLRHAGSGRVDLRLGVLARQPEPRQHLRREPNEHREPEEHDGRPVRRHRQQHLGRRDRRISGLPAEPAHGLQHVAGRDQVLVQPGSRQLANLGWGCDNNHDIMCWNAYLNDAMPRFMTAMGQARLRLTRRLHCPRRPATWWPTATS